MTTAAERLAPASYRQGDVLLVRLPDEAIEASEALRGTAAEVRRDAGDRLVLAEGEETGHAHAIADTKAALLEVPSADDLFLLVYGDEPVALRHEEHDTIAVSPGAYRVIRQRQHTPQQRDVGPVTQTWDYVGD